MLVKDAMTLHATWIAPDTSLVEVAKLMRDQGIGCLPIGENDRLVGMITDRDVVCRGVADGADPARVKARDVMSKGVKWCFEDQKVDEAAQMMDNKQIHHLPVLNREKRMVGMLSVGDLALKGSPELFQEVCRLASRDASRHGSAHSAH